VQGRVRFVIASKVQAGHTAGKHVSCARRVPIGYIFGVRMPHTGVYGSPDE